MTASSTSSADAPFVFSWEFLRRMSVWSAWIAASIALVGGLITRDIRFTVSCGLAASVDVLLVSRAASRAMAALDSGSIDSSSSSMLLAGRLALKAVLLGIAFLLPQLFSFVGTVAGVLVYDLTVATVGSVIAVRENMRSARESR